MKKFVFLLVLIAAALYVWKGRQGCGGPTEAPLARYLSKSAELVVEVPNIGLFAERPELLTRPFEGIATAEQQAALQSEVVRMLGVDPFSAKGLEAAGFPKKGRAVVELVDQGRGALLVVPVAEPKFFANSVKQYASSRASIQKTETRTVDGQSMEVLLTVFGPDEVPVVAHTVQGSLGFVGIGRRGAELVAAALNRKPEDSLLGHAEYESLRQAFTGARALELYAPNAGAAAKGLLRRLGQTPGLDTEALAAELLSLGGVVRLEPRSVESDLELRFSEAGRARLDRVWKSGGPTPAGVRALRLPDAVLTILASADLAALLREAAPAGSPLAADLDRSFARLQDDTGIDFKNEVVPRLSGHAAVSFGFGDLRQFRSIRDVLQNPMGLLFTDFGFGVKDVAGFPTFDTLAPKVDPILEQRGFKRETREIEGVKTTAIVGKDRPDFLLAQTFLHGGSLMIANHAGRAEKLIRASKEPPEDLLADKAGLVAELRFGPLLLALRQVDLDQVIGGGPQGLVVKAMVSKVLLALGQLDTLRFELHKASAGLRFRGRLDLLDGGRAKP